MSAIQRLKLLRVAIDAAHIDNVCLAHGAVTFDSHNWYSFLHPTVLHPGS